MSEEQSDSAIMDPWDMIDLDADKPLQFHFESPSLPEPVWNGDENKIFAANVGGYQPPQPYPQPCAMDVSGKSGNQPPQPVIHECLPEGGSYGEPPTGEEAMKMTELYYGSPLSGYQPLQFEPQPFAIDENVVFKKRNPSKKLIKKTTKILKARMSQENSHMLKMIEAEVFADGHNVGGNPPPQLQPQPDWDMEKM
ncbi:hypothetical protein HN51_045798 [Arachis hypogaea]|uniref:uncharacterized protein LOC110265788 n=1 Tax=Arachis ipaensis TaxID=130454 RepID=UPI000A2B33A4|nr:uncharacterized protein LOC110265788 [Arachis ipaensis]